jgi:hypothetical protein
VGFDQQTRRKVYALPFRPYPGLTVWCRKPGFTALEDLTDAVLALGDDLAGERLPSPERVRWWGVLHRAFAASLVGWDLLDGGHAVPATEDGVLAQDPGFLLAVSRAWYYAVVLRDEQTDEIARADPEPPDIPDVDEIDELESRLADIPVTVHEPEPVPA